MIQNSHSLFLFPDLQNSQSGSLLYRQVNLLLSIMRSLLSIFHLLKKKKNHDKKNFGEINRL